MNPQEFFLPIGRKEKLACFFYPPNAKTFPILVAVHGFSTDHQGKKIKELIHELPKKGWGVLACDLRFHGKSSGKIEDIHVDANVEDVRTLVSYAFAMKGVESVSLYGSSYGGMLAIIAAIEFPMIPLLGLVAPVTDFVEQRGISMPQEELAKWKKRGYNERLCADGKIHKIKYQYYESMQPYHKNLYRMAPKIKSTTFIIQGDADASVPIKLTKKFFNLLDCEKELVIVPGADHKFSNPTQHKNLMSRVIDFYTSGA